MPQGLAIATVDVSFPLLAPNGSVAAPSYAFSASPNTGIYSAGIGYLGLVGNGLLVAGVDVATGFQTYNDKPLGLGTGLLAADVLLYRDAADVLALRRGVNTQTFRLGNSAACPAIADSAGGLSIIVNCSVGVNNGFPVWLFDTAGSLSPHVAYNNAIDIGASGRVPRSIYAGTSFIAPVGSAASPAFVFDAPSNTPQGLYILSPRQLAFATDGFNRFITGYGATEIGAGDYFGWSNGTNNVGSGVADVLLWRDAAGVLAQKNGTNAQEFRVYGSTTGPKYVSLSATTTYGLVTTTVGLSLKLGADLSGWWMIENGSAVFRPEVTGSYPIGTASYRVSSLYLGGNTVTASTPMLDRAQTWNDAGVTFIGSDTNITATLYAAASLIERWRVGGSQVAALRADGVMMANYLGLASGVTFRGYLQATADGVFAMLSGSGAALTSLSWGTDATVTRLAAASMQVGGAASATPINQTFTIGESSRGTTDNNVAGANGTLRCGAGTGNAAGASLIFETPTPTASGVVAQVYAQRLSLSVLGATFDIPDQGLRINNQVNGAGVSSGTLTNAPSAGNPNFWLPLNVNGTVYMFPGW